MTDQSLRLQNLLKVQSEDLWRAIYDEMLPRVFHYFAYRVGDTRLAEDLSATTFEKAWRSRRQFRREKGALDRWLFGIARRVLADHYRRIERTTDLENGILENQDRTVEQIAEKNSAFRKLGRLLICQPERTRDLIALKYGAGMNNREIAALTGLSESNVGSILHRAVKDLRRQWEHEDG